jgi:hypothetical protein
MKKHRRSDISPTKKQVGGDHYKQLEISPAEFIYKNNLNWYVGNAIKYLVRFDKKHSNKAKQVEDLDKATHYIQLLIEQLNK